MTKVIGVRFRTAGKIYFFAPGKFEIKQGDNVIVETARGVEFGRVVSGPKDVKDEEVVQPLKPVIRMASDQDRRTVEKNKQKEKEAFKICLEKIRKHNLEMKLIDVEYTFDGTREKLIDIMHNYGSYSDCKVILVFDGYKVAGNREKKEEKNKNLTIVFTKDGQTADSYIEKEVHNVGRKYEVYVVTSDWMEQQTIFQRGAVRMSSLEFYNEVMKTEKNIRMKSEKIKNPNKNHLQDNIDNEVLKKLEDMRRSK